LFWTFFPSLLRQFPNSRILWVALSQVFSTIVINHDVENQGDLTIIPDRAATGSRGLYINRGNHLGWQAASIMDRLVYLLVRFFHFQLGDDLK
jgi:hypothetical protein